METLLRYFPDLTAAQRERFAVLDEAYRTWNERINVISRKDIDRLYPHHVLHSLAIAKVCALRPGAQAARCEVAAMLQRLITAAL